MNFTSDFTLNEFLATDLSTIFWMGLIVFATSALAFFIRRRNYPKLKLSIVVRWLVFTDYLPPLLTFAGLFLFRYANLEHVNYAAAHLATLVFGSLALVRAVAFMLRRFFSKRSSWTKWSINFLSALVWLLVVLHLSGALSGIISDLKGTFLPFGDNDISAWDVIESIFSMAITLFAALWVASLIDQRLKSTPMDVNMRLVISRIMRVVLLVLAILAALSASGIDLTVLSVFGGALGVGIGFGMQKIMANYISGFLVLFEGSLRVGDRVRVDTFEGDITSINTRYTVLRSVIGVEAIVPNETLITTRVENLTLMNRHLCLNTVVGIAYHSDVELAIDLIKAATLSVERVLENPEPNAYLQMFADSSINIVVYFWIDDLNGGQINVISEVNLAILRTLRKHNIEIPFPQRVLHMPAQATLSDS